MSRGIRKIILGCYLVEGGQLQGLSLSWPLEDIFERERKAWAACESEWRLAAAERGGVVWPLRILLAGSCSKGRGDPIDDCEKFWRAFWELGQGASWRGFFHLSKTEFLRGREAFGCR